MASPRKRARITPINCPLCNIPRMPRLVTLENSKKILCNTPSCRREIYSETDTFIPSKIKESPLYLNEYIENFHSIGTGLVVLGNIQAVFNVRLRHLAVNVTEIISYLTDIHKNQVYSYKVAISFGRLLSRKEEGENEQVKYFHASANNASIFSHDDHYNMYWLVDSEISFQNCIREIQDRVIEDTNRPHTKWQVIGNVNANITLLRPSGGGVLMGKLDSLPTHLRGHGMLHFHRHPITKRIIQDNLCFFRCLSFFLYKNDSHITELFHRVYGSNTTIKDYKGLSMLELNQIERLLDIKIHVYKLCKRSPKALKKGEKKTYVKVIRSGLTTGNSVMNLNLHKNHFSLIEHMVKYGQVFSCAKCKRVFASNFSLKRHTAIKRDCTQVTFKYKGGVYKPNRTVFQKLAEYGIETPKDMCIYPYKIVFDFESYFSKRADLQDNMKCTSLEQDHIPLSASVASDFPGHTHPVCFVRENNRADNPIVYTVLNHINNLAIAIGKSVLDKYQDILDSLRDLIAEQKRSEIQGIKLSKMIPHNKSMVQAEKLQLQLLTYIKRVPVIGFNSGRYDLNLIKRDFHSFFTQNNPDEITTIKRGNQYIAVYTEHLIFLDVFNYLSPGYTYANYLKAFVGDTEKGIFPYGWMDGTRKLKRKSLPPHHCFYNNLTCKNITKEEYKSCQEVWKEKKMVTFRDYLIHYNNLDVAPFVRAINTHATFFNERNVDMFKDGVSLPGLTLKFLFQNNTTPYVLFCQRDKDIHTLLRQNLVGGPSIIFHRRHLKGETKIRERQYGSESNVCKKVYGMDANSLYLKCMAESHCTGFYTVRRRENRFVSECSQRVSYSALEWLRYRAHKDGVPMLHQYNYGEVCLGGNQIPVDGYVPGTKTVYQFHGCYWHGHVCHLTKSVLTTEKGRKWIDERSEKTMQVTLYLKGLGYTVIEQYECKWHVLKEESICQECRQHWVVNRPNTPRRLTQEEILIKVENGTLFGMVQVDIHTPEHLKKEFEEMTPIFKNKLVSREDVGVHMKEYLEENNKLTKPQRQLIGSYYGEKMLLGTPLLQWYLKKGLVVTQVYIVVEYTPEKTFNPFVKEVTEARRSGDENSDCKIMSDLYKLLGNAAYGKTITNKQNFLNTRYVTQRKARRLVLHWTVQQANDISQDTVELSCLPHIIKYDLPIQIGFMVYQYAKLKMLSFYYDFLVKFIDITKFELCEVDTDSFYIALSEDTLDAAVYPEKRYEYFSERHLWLPSESCDIDYHRETYIACKTHNLPWIPQPCCRNRLIYDKRTPGLFKNEWEGDGLTSLSSKSYAGVDEKSETSKVSCKGVIQKQNNLTLGTYDDVLHNRKSHMILNKGFKVVDHHMVTYTQAKQGLTYQYIKRKVCSDGVSTVPLDI